MSFHASSASTPGHPGIPATGAGDDVAHQVLARLAAQVVDMGAHGFRLALLQAFDDADEPQEADGDDEEDAL